MQLFLMAIVVCVSWYVGMVCLTVIGKKTFTETLGVGFLLGSFILTILQTLLLEYFNIPIQLDSLMIILALLLYVAFFLTKQPPFYYWLLLKQTVSTKFNLIEKILIVTLLILIAYSLVQNIFWPVTDWDALALYDFRARVVAEDGNFNRGFELGYFYQYPPYTSLLHTDAYLAHYNRPKIWYSILYGAFLLAYYALVRRKTTRISALIGCLSLAVNPIIFEHSIMAYTNLAYIAYLSIGLLYLIEWFGTKQASDSILGAVLVAGSTWIRETEPLWLIPVFILLWISGYQLFKQKNLKYFFLSLTSIVMIIWVKGLWLHYVGQLTIERNISTHTVPAVNNISSSTSIWTNSLAAQFINYASIVFSSGFNILLLRLREVSVYFYSFILPVFSCYIGPAVILYILDVKAYKKPFIPIFILIIVYCLYLYIGTYVFSFLDTSWAAIGGSATRVSMFLVPLWIYSIYTSKILTTWVEKWAK